MPYCPRSSAIRTATGALLLILAMAGCDSEAESSAAAPPSPEATPTATESRAASVNASREATATRQPNAPQTTKAPGGGDTKYPECADGDCTVSFSGSVTFDLRGWTVSVSVEKGGARARLTKPNGWGGVGGFMAGPGCAVEIRGDGGGRVGCDKPRTNPEPGGYVVHLRELNGNGAVIRAILG